MKSIGKAIATAAPMLRTTVGYGVLELATRAVQATAIFLLAYVFRKDEFGAFYGYLAVYQLTTVLGTGGLLESLMGGVGASEDARAKRQVAATHTRFYIWRSSWILSASIAIAAAAALLDCKINMAALAFAVAGGLSYGLVILLATFLTYSGSNRLSMYLRFAYTFVSYALACCAALYSRQILEFFMGLFVGGVITLLVLSAINRRGAALSKEHRSPPEAKRNSYGWFLIPATLNWFFWYGLVLFVSSLFGTVRAAELAFANNIASVLLMVNTAVSQAWVSRYLRGFAASPAVTEAQTARVFRLQSALMTGAAIALVAVYELLLAGHFPLAMKYAHLGYQISILLFSISISSSYFGVINAFAVNGRGLQLAMISIAAYLCSVVVLVGLSIEVGVLGVYFGLALLIVSRGFTLTWYARKHLGAGFIDARLIAMNAVLFIGCAWYYFYGAAFAYQGGI